MDEVDFTSNPPTLPALAALISDHFPELGGRSIAVSEIQPFGDATNVPTLPIAVTALVSEQADQNKNGGGSIRLESDLMVTFIFEPVKYTRSDGSDTPFFSFYDYESLRDRVLSATQYWISPRGSGISYKSLDVASDEFAVYISFRFTMRRTWSNPLPREEPGSVKIVYRAIQPTECCVPVPEQDCGSQEPGCSYTHIVNGIEQESP